jgi:hypothetical protein
MSLVHLSQPAADRAAHGIAADGLGERIAATGIEDNEFKPLRAVCCCEDALSDPAEIGGPDAAAPARGRWQRSDAHLYLSGILRIEYTNVLERILRAIRLDNGEALHTLCEAAQHVIELPPRESALDHWQTAMTYLLAAAENRRPQRWPELR